MLKKIIFRGTEKKSKYISKYILDFSFFFSVQWQGSQLGCRGTLGFCVKVFMLSRVITFCTTINQSFQIVYNN